MAETVYFNDGSMEVVLTDKALFLEEVLREKLGQDVSNCFLDCIRDFEEDLKLAKEESRDQERSVDGYFQMCNDAMESFESALNLLKAPGRLDRKHLTATVQAGYDDLYNNL